MGGKAKKNNQKGKGRRASQSTRQQRGGGGQRGDDELVRRGGEREYLDGRDTKAQRHQGKGKGNEGRTTNRKRDVAKGGDSRGTKKISLILQGTHGHKRRKKPSVLGCRWFDCRNTKLGDLAKMIAVGRMTTLCFGDDGKFPEEAGQERALLRKGVRGGGPGVRNQIDKHLKK